MMQTMIGWVLKIALPRLMPAIVEAVMSALPKGQGTYWAVGWFIVSQIALAATNVYDPSLGVAPATAGTAIGGAIIAAYLRRGQETEQEKTAVAVEKVDHKVETVTEDVAAVQEQMKETTALVAEAAKVESWVPSPGPNPVKRKPGGSGRF